MKFQRLSIDGKQWGTLKFLRPIVAEGEDPWGELAVLKETPYEKLIPVIPGEVFSHAQHGYLPPLFKVLGPEPKALSRLLPKEYRKCKLAKTCLMFREKECLPGPSLPDCFEPPGLENPAAVPIAAMVALAWKEGRYVVVVEGAEFSL